MRQWFPEMFEVMAGRWVPVQHVLAPEIDWSTLKLESGSFVDEKFADEHSDLLFSADARGSGERVLV